MKTAHKRTYLVLVLISLVCTGATGAIDEGPDYSYQYWNDVWPYFQNGYFGSLEGTGGVRLAYAIFNAEAVSGAGALVFLPGKSETYLKYAELVYDLRQLAFTIYILDHRGMGFSDHLVADDGDKVFVQEFEYYVDDLELFLKSVVEPNGHSRLILAGHSMGGAVALRHLERYPGRFERAVVNTPMLQLDTGSTPEWLAYSVSTCLSWFGLGKKYAFGYGPWKQGTFEKNELTHSRDRWSIWWQQLVPKFAEVESHGPTLRWVSQSMGAAKSIIGAANEIEIPILMFQAGKDGLVRPGGQHRFAERAPDCRIRRFENAYHEVLIETDEIRNEAIDLLTAFISGEIQIPESTPN